MSRVPQLQLDIIHGDVHLDGISFRQDRDTQAQVVRSLRTSAWTASTSGAASRARNCMALSEFLWQLKDTPDRRADGGSAREALDPAHQPRPSGPARHALEDAHSGRTRPTGHAGPRPTQESLALTERTFEDVVRERASNLATIRDIVDAADSEGRRAAMPRSVRFSPSSSTRTSPIAIR